MLFLLYKLVCNKHHKLIDQMFKSGSLYLIVDKESVLVIEAVAQRTVCNCIDPFFLFWS